MRLGVAIAAMAVSAVLSGPALAEEDRADRAAVYLQAAQKDDGLFRYEFDFVTGRWSGSDNMVRQAGTAYGLALYYSRRPDSGLRENISRALGALAARSVPYAGGYVVSSDGTLGEARTGATALALAAAVLSGTQDVPAREWLAALLALQREDGRFRRAPLRQSASGYYDGEAWLALALMAEAGDMPEAARAALERSDEGLIGHYSDRPRVSFFHWGELAAAARFRATGEARFLDFAASQAEAFLSDLRPRAAARHNSCYSVEGLTAALETVSADPRLEKLRGDLRARLAAELAHNGALQVEPGQRELALRRGGALRAAELPAFAGAFMNGTDRPQARVDSTQHCLAAFLQAAGLGLD